jgi:hypothetical protein
VGRACLVALALGIALAIFPSCRAATRSRNVGSDFRCPASQPQAFDYCGLPDDVRGHASDDGCVPWPLRPPNLWMAFCCPEPEDETGVGTCR